MLIISNNAVPEPIVPIISLKIDKNPINTPPSTAAIGIFLLSTLYIDDYYLDAISISASWNILKTSTEDLPLISNQNLLNKPQVVHIKVTYSIKWVGLYMISIKLSGGSR